MNIRPSKLLLAALALSAAIPGISAAAPEEKSGTFLETKSGRLLENYTIVKQSGLTVTVRHMDGEAKIPLTDLPDDIARPYIQKAIEQRVAAAMRESDPEKRIRRLEKLAKQLPAAEERVRELIAQARKEKDVQSGAENKTQPEAAAAEPAAKAEAAAAEATAQEEAATTETAADAPNREEQEKQLLELLRQQQTFTPDRAQWQAFFRPYYAVEQTMVKAGKLYNEALQQQKMQCMEEAVTILEKIIEQQPQTANIQDAQTMLNILRLSKNQIPVVEQALQEVRQEKTSSKIVTILQNIIRTAPLAPNILTAKKYLTDCQAIMTAIEEAQKCKSDGPIERYKRKAEIIEAAMKKNTDALNIEEAQQAYNTYLKTYKYARTHICKRCEGKGYIEVQGEYLGSYTDDSISPMGAYRGRTIHRYGPSKRIGCPSCGGKGFK